MKVLLLALLLAAQKPDDVARKIDAAAALVDAGKFDAAVAALKKIVDAHPKNATAKYELALAYAAKGSYRRCRTILEPLAAKEGTAQISALALLGNCLDALGEHERALATFRKGLKLAPDDSQILYNLAGSLSKEEKYDEARQLLERNLRANPDDVQAHDLLGRIFDAQNFRTPAVFSYLHFLALDPSSPGAAESAERLRVLLSDSKIDLKPDTRKEEGDYASMDILISASAAARGTEEEAALSEFEQMRLQVAHLIENFIISDALAKHDDFTSAVQQPFFRAAWEQKLVDTLAGVVLSPLGIKGQEAWAKANEAEVARYSEWLAPQLGRPVVHLRK